MSDICREVFDTPEAVNYRTKRALDRIDLVRGMLDGMDADRKRSRRMVVQECPYCFYIRGGTICGQAFTDYTCGHCQQRKRWHNTAVPKLCKECAEKLGLCIRCGADMELCTRPPQSLPEPGKDSNDT